MFQDIFQKTINKPLQLNESLAKYTTIGIGGPAEYFCTVTDEGELKKILELTASEQVPVTILGGGSNVLISDIGIKGLVIRSQIKTFKILQESMIQASKNRSVLKTDSRLEQLKDTSAYQADALQPSFSASDEIVYAQIGAGWKMNDLIVQTFSHNLTGLEWFAGIPGSLGGAIYMNMHGGTYFWSNFINSVRVLDRQGNEKLYTVEEMKFEYDYSILHKTNEFIIDANVILFKGDVEQAKKIYQYWASKKIVNQPQKSAGCIFQNITEEQKLKARLPTSSIGYMIDKVLGLKGKQVGGAQISLKHAAFIENIGGATSQDVKALTDLIEATAKEKLGIELTKEVEFLG